MFGTLHLLIFIVLINQVIGANKDSTALDIIENHLSSIYKTNASKPAALESIETKNDLRNEIVLADKKYLQRMMNFHSIISTFWRHTKTISQFGNYIALSGGVLASSLDFYYRYHDPEQSKGNSIYNNVSFSFALAAFSTNLLQMIAYRMHSKSEAIKIHLRKSLDSANPLESFVKLERADSEFSEVRMKKSKKDVKKNKSPKCSAISPSDHITESKKVRASRESYDYIHNVIQINARLANVSRSINSITEFINVFATIGTSVVTGIDFFYRKNDLAGSSENSDYNKAAIILSILSILTKVSQTISLKQLQKSETKHIHMLLALNASNVLEAFKNLEKGIYPYDNTQQPNKVLERTETKESIQSDKNLQKAMALLTK